MSCCACSRVARRLSSWCAAGLPPGSTRHDLYRGASRRADPARDACRTGGLEYLPFLQGVQAVVRVAAAPLPHEPRIEHAKTLLAKPALSVTDIGMTVGFSETSSFTAAFRKATGLTPSAYHRSLV